MAVFLSYFWHLEQCQFSFLYFNKISQKTGRLYSVVLKDFAIDAKGLGLNSQAAQIGLSVANGSQSLRRFFGAALPRRYAAGSGPATRYHVSVQQRI